MRPRCRAHAFALLLAHAFLVASAQAQGSPTMPASAPAPVAATTLLVVYVETELRQPGLTSGPDADLVEWKVPDVGRLLQQRVPLVLAANGMSGSAVTLKGLADEGALAALSGPRPMLLLSISSFVKSGGAFRKAGSVVLDARLFDRGPPEPPRWQGSLGGVLGFDPVLGVLKTNRVDEQWVDGIVVGALDRLAQRDLVRLSGPKALRPKP